MRLSVTTVEAFRLWRDSGDWMALEELEATIKRETVPNEKMLRGSAFHTVLEAPVRTEAMGSAYYEANGYRFEAGGMDAVLALMPADRVSETKTEIRFDGITLVGKCDALHGLIGYEGKCSEKIDIERYLDSFQWRAYIRMFNLASVVYILAQGRDTGGGFIVIDSVLPMPLYRYPLVDADVRRLALDCAEFIESRNLSSYVQEQAA